MDCTRSSQTCVELVIRLKCLHPASNRMFSISDLHLENAARIVRTHLWIPCAAGQIGKPGPVLPRATRKMNQHQSFAALHKAAQILARIFARRRLLPVHKMHDDDICLLYTSDAADE